MLFWIKRVDPLSNLEMPSKSSLFELDILTCSIGFKRQVFSSPFGFNLLSKEDASL